MNVKENLLVVPKVDILMPCYNSAVTLERTIDSLLSQSFKNFRVILIDNNSMDDSVKIFESLGDERFEVKRYSDTVSLGANFNRCLEHVLADFYCIMHADDEYQPNYLSVMLASIEKNSKATLAFCNANIIDEASNIKSSIKNSLKKKSSPSGDILYSGSCGLSWISEYNKIIAPSVMYRRSAVALDNQFNPGLKFTLDWEYYFRILQSGGQLLHVNQVLFNYRIHSKQQTAALIASMEKYYEMQALLNSMYEYMASEYKSVENNRYKFLKYTIVVDFFNDLKKLQFAHALKKFCFIVQLFNSKSTSGVK